MKHWWYGTLAPVMVVSAIVIPMGARPATVGGHVLAYALSGVLLLATLGLFDSARFAWALRAVAAAIALGGLLYIGWEFSAWRAGKPFGLVGPRSQSSLRNALLFFLVFGVPSLRYLLFGRTGGSVDALARPSGEDDDAGRSVQRE